MKGGGTSFTNYHLTSICMYLHTLYLVTGQMRWCTPLIPELGRQRQAIQEYRMRLCLIKYMLGAENMAQCL